MAIVVDCLVHTLCVLNQHNYGKLNVLLDA